MKTQKENAMLFIKKVFKMQGYDRDNINARICLLNGTVEDRRSASIEFYYTAKQVLPNFLIFNALCEATELPMYEIKGSI